MTDPRRALPLPGRDVCRGNDRLHGVPGDLGRPRAEGRAPKIDRYLGNVYFDEKIDGTIHLALGFGFDYLGGTNESAIHWDIVKDLRAGGRIELDGRVVQENGAWVA